MPYKDIGWDQLRIYFPFYKVTFDAFAHFQFPFWNPYAFSGHPHFADFQTAILYPLNIFGLVLSQIAFWHLLRVTPTILASFFTFIYLKNLKLSTLASFFGALIFGFSPFIVTWGEEVVMSPHSVLFLPLILLAVDKLVEKFSKNYFLVLALSIASSIFAGYIQTTIYVLLFAVTYLIFRIKSQNLDFRKFVSVILIMGVGGLIGAIQLLPSAELFFSSVRSGVNFSNVIREFLLSPAALVTYLVPDFFGNPATRNHFLPGAAHYYESILFVGIAPLLFAFHAFGKKGLAIFLWVWALIGVLVVINWPGARFLVGLPIPLISTAIPNRILFIPAFCLAILGSVGFDFWLKEKKRYIFVPLFFGLVYFLIFASLFVIKSSHFSFFGSVETVDSRIAISMRNMLVPTAVFGLLATVIIFFKNKQMAAVLIILICAAHIFYFSSKYLVFSDKKYVFGNSDVIDYIIQNQGENRTIFVGDHVFSTNFATQYSIYNPEGYDSLNNGVYSKYIFGAQNFDSGAIALRRSDAELGFKNNLGIAFADANKRKLLNTLGVRYLISKGDDRLVLVANGFKSVFESGDLNVFENQQAFPRAFLTAEPNTLERGNTGSLGQAKIISYKPWRVVVRADVTSDSTLVLTDNYYNGWRAKVDGVKADVSRVGATFRGVWLSVGQHEIEFYFDSQTVKIGRLISLFGLVITSVIITRKKWRKS